MPLNMASLRQCLQSFDFRALFIEELGWDRHSGNLSVVVDGKPYSLQAIAEKRGFQVFECPTSERGRVPDYPTRSKIDRQVAKSAHEHIIIYTDAAKTVQKWQWVRREIGRPLARREYDFFKGQTGELLAQRLQYLAVDLSEEEDLSLVDVTRRARQAFDVDRATKRFYDRFKTEHAAFLKFVKGITAVSDREWYASLMLNRLMFIYFIQKKGFLDGDPDYLRNRLKMVQERKGKDKFLTFYRYFLLRLFHEGLGQPAALRKKDLDDLLGNVPYLNGGLFSVHKLEQAYPNIQIADDAFERLFRFFDAYQWHLDERPLRADNEINPDVLGYIFEKYVNQKQMGAYYTKEDITGYIARNTIIPFLFNAAAEKCPTAFRLLPSPSGRGNAGEGLPAVWRLLRDDPDRYIYPAVKHGVIRTRPSPSGKGDGGEREVVPEWELPDFVQTGMHDPKARMFDNRYNLQQAPAGDPIRLVTETWREYIYRRNRCLEIREKLARGEVHDINDLITLNLDICQFAQDVIANCEDPELLRAFWHAIKNVSVLDPTCGSGAFLFAALNILEPLYEACLERMEAFLEDLQRSGEKHHPEKFSDFRKVLDDVAQHPNRRYFVLKSIIIGNLYGVDIMEEAVEICKLRLFLKLVAQVENAKQIEPLPDIDFNIRPGNTLVGFASLNDVKKTLQGSLGFGKQDVERIIEEAECVDRAFAKFRQMQTEHGMSPKDFSEAKAELRQRLDKLREEVDRYLAGEYGVDVEKPKLYDQWRKSHQPFHWFAEFYGIMAGGGFDVIIGNPPYVQYKDVTPRYSIIGFQSDHCGDLYALCTERSLQLTSIGGRLGLILPISIFCTDGFEPLQKILLRRLVTTWISFYANRPSQLFGGAQKRLTILLGYCGDSKVTNAFTTGYFRWQREEFDHLFRARLQYGPHHPIFTVLPASLEKLGSAVEVMALSRLNSAQGRLAEAVARPTKFTVYYTRKFGYFLAFTDFIPEIVEQKSGRRLPPSELKEFALSSSESVNATVAALSSSTFFWFWNVLSDCRNLNRRDLLAFPLNPDRLSPEFKKALSALGKQYLMALKETSRTMLKSGLRIQTFRYADCKPIIDEIDCLLAKHYGFTDEELDFIVNYDIKYRMGQDGGDEGGEH